MNIFNIEYYTKNKYDSFVNEGMLEFRILPLVNESQFNLTFSLQNNLKLNYSTYLDWQQNQVLTFSTQTHFNKFELTFQAEITTKNINYFSYSFPVFEEEEKLTQEISYQINNFLYLKQTNYTQLPKNWYLDTIKKKQETIWEFTCRIKDFVFKEFKYKEGVTTVETNARDFIKLKQGICMDFAHLLIGIFRENNIATRYVGGYLFEGIVVKETLKSNSAMHAWVEFHIPNLGWFGIDPSNNLFVNNHYVKVCHGLDYADCQPIKGVLKTNGKNVTSHTVKVKRKVLDDSFNE